MAFDLGKRHIIIFCDVSHTVFSVRFPSHYSQEEGKRETMEHTDFSRRSFLKGAGLAGLTAGILGATELAAPRAAVAAEAAEGASLNEYQKVFGEDTNYIPVKKAEWDQLDGFVAYDAKEFKDSDIARTDECDFLVIGQGIGGTIAALKAADEGVNVIALEKMNRGRNTWESVGGYNSKLQQEIDNVPDPAEYVEAVMRSSYWRARPDVVWGFVNQSGEAIDFMNDMLQKAGKGVSLYSTVQKDNGYGIDTIQAEHKLKFPEGVEKKWNTWWRGPVAFDSLETTQAAYSNLDVRYNTAAVQLTRNESGRVTGAIAKDADGYYKVEAKNGVLLATGGYESNPGMMESWCRPEDYNGCCVYAPNSGNTGDGHMMGLAVGAQMDPLPHTLMVFRSGLPGRVMDASMVSKCFTSSIWTDFKGRRFVNEKLPHNFVANAISEAGISGKPVWFVFDQAIVDGVKDTTGKLAADIEDGKQRGELVQADTIEGLAEAMGADVDTLAETISTWNSYFDAAEPADLMFRRSLKSAATKIATGPFYACKHNSKVLVSMSGLIINEHAQVLDGNEEVIEGLYATGNVSGGMFSISYPRHLPATSTGRAATFGYVAAKHAVKGE